MFNSLCSCLYRVCARRGEMCLLDQKLTTVSNKAIPLVAVEQSKAVVVVSFLDCTSVDLILFYFIASSH